MRASSWLFMVLCAVLLASPAPVHAQTATDRSEVMIQQFAADDGESPQRRIDTRTKHRILFLMGIALLVLLLATGAMGIAMAAFGKDVFVAHMILAGLSMTLAIVHAATSIAWFWPY